MEKLGLNQSELARRAGVAQPTVYKLLNGQTRTSARLHAIAEVLQTNVPWLMGEDTDPDAGIAVPPTLDEVASEYGLVPIREIDLMRGADFVCDRVPVTGEEIHFDRKWLKRFTDAEPDQLYFGRSIGDAMAPTISASDSILVDTTKTKANISDCIWAILVGQTVMVKRLRAMPSGFEIISDNPLIPPAVVALDEIKIIGRVVSVVHHI